MSLCREFMALTTRAMNFFSKKKSLPPFSLFHQTIFFFSEKKEPKKQPRCPKTTWASCCLSTRKYLVATGDKFAAPLVSNPMHLVGNDISVHVSHPLRGGAGSYGRIATGLLFFYYYSICTFSYLFSLSLSPPHHSLFIHWDPILSPRLEIGPVFTSSS